MENSDILARFHELNYQENLSNLSRSGVEGPVSHQTSRLRAKTIDWAKRDVCRIGLLRRSALCDDETV